MSLARFRRLRSLVAFSLVAVAAVLAVRFVAVVPARLRRAVVRASTVPLSPLTAGWRVGANYPERRDILAEGDIAGEMDDVDEFASPEFDPDALDPAVRAFYERTADYELAYRVTWHRPFRLGAALAGELTSRIEQLNLPGPAESGVRELRSRFARVDPTADPREGARAWVRTREDGAAVFVAVYAHHESDGTRYVNIAVPLPGSNLSTVLRPETLALGDEAERTGLELTTLDDDGDGDGDNNGDEGLYLVTPIGSVALPLDQRFRVWPAGASISDAPAGVTHGDADTTDGDADVVATHEMWAFGRRFLTVTYAAQRADGR